MKLKAFTLAELLIALLILGVISTFTIPKVLTAQSKARYTSVTKEMAATVVNAYQMYQVNNTATGSMMLKDTITPFLNYVKIDTVKVGAVDYPFSSQADCTATSPCYYFANGAVIQLYPVSFSGTASTNAVWFLVDPDGANSNSPQGGGVEVLMYFNGRLVTWPGVLPGTTTSWGPYSANPTGDPTWFTWN